MPYFVSIGVERKTAGTVAMLIPLISLGARIPFGMLSDIFKKKHVMAFSIGLKGIGLLFFWLTGQGIGWAMVFFLVIFGIGSGGMTPVRTPIIREYFGTKRFGTIFGISSIFFTIGMVLAPPIAGWVFDRFATYQPVWLALGALALAGAVLMVTTPAPGSNNKEPVQSSSVHEQLN
jgi:MFS family permease